MTRDFSSQVLLKNRERSIDKTNARSARRKSQCRSVNGLKYDAFVSRYCFSNCILLITLTYDYIVPSYESLFSSFFKQKKTVELHISSNTSA